MTTARARPAVMIVEDEAIVACDLQEILETMGYEVSAIAASADEALAHAAARCPDLVLMDIRIDGDRDGIATAHALRERFGVPVVYLTAHADTATLARATESSPYGYLLKPVKPAELRSAIEVSLHRHAMERRLRERERWFATTLDSIGDAVVTVDLANTVTYMNAAGARLTGVAADDAIGRPADEVVRLLDHQAPLATALARRAEVRLAEAQLQAADGGVRTIADSAAPVLDDGTMLGAVMVFRDVTDQKQQQRQLELADRLASLGTLSAGVAHEINNPLAIILGSVSLALQDLAAVRGAATAAEAPGALASLAESLADIEAAGQRVSRIVNELQTFSRRPPARTNVGSIDEAIGWAVRSTAHELRMRATVVVEGERDLHVALDDTRLGQVLVNLLMNAAHAIEPGNYGGNRVTIGARRAGDTVEIRVADTGCGIAPDIVGRIFDPFFTTRPVGGGTGLGLAVCHGIVQAAKGEIRVTSEPGRGTAFVIALPQVPTPTPTHRIPRVREATPWRRGRILIVDDETALLATMQRVLAGHEVITTPHATEALACLAMGEKFDLVLCDLTMPAMSGEEFYTELLARSPATAQRVAFVTGGATSPRLDTFLAAVPNRRLEKPIATQTLRDFVQRALAELPAAS